MLHRIREMVEDDIARGYLECLDSLSIVHLSIGEAYIAYRTIGAAGVRIFVAIDRLGLVLGTISVLIEPKFIHRAGKVGHIEDVAVRISQQGSGIGKQLVEHAINYCKSQGCYKVILNCSEQLVPFYSKLGFSTYDVGMRLDCACEAPSDRVSPTAK